MEEINEKVIDKIRKLHAKAESCEKIGSQAEAEAFAAMVNQLLIRHNLSMASVEWAQRNEEDPIIKEWVDFQAYNIDIKYRRVQWSEQLASLICQAHFCKLLLSNNSNQLCFVGHKTNREVAEYLFVTMYRLATVLSEKAYVAYFYECRGNGDVTLARGFKSAWLYGFLQGLRERFDQERKAVNVPVNSSALVKVNQTLGMVEKWLNQNIKAKMARGLNQFKFNNEGVKRGKQAAADVSLRANAIRHNPSQGQKSVGH
jgi:hypothetical protein